MLKIDDWVLIHEDTGENVMVGDIIKTFRGEEVVLKGGRPPHKIGSTGRIHVEQADCPNPYLTALHQEYFPSVCGLKWVHIDPAVQLGAEWDKAFE